MTTDDFKAFVNGYLECALWTATDDDGNPLDAYHSADDFTEEAVQQARRDCRQFLALPGIKGALVPEAYSSHGHDFWLTRNGHGTGFWDRGYRTETGKLLTDAAHSFGDANVFVARGKRLAFG